MDEISASLEIKNWVQGYLEREAVNLKIVRSRKRKLGDFRYNFSNKEHLITLNANLTEGTFLLTFLHELAHKRCNESFGRKVKPHGAQWKFIFQELLREALTLNLSDADEKLFRKTIQSPKARFQNDCENIDGLTLKDIGEHEEFLLLNSDRIFIRLEKMRTRYRCQLKNTQKYYTVSANAQISRLTN